MRRILIFAVSLALSSSLRADEGAAEPEVLREAVAIARAGGLGFDLPEGWNYNYEPLYGACGRILGSGCIPVSDSEPFEEGGKYEPVWALTTRSIKHTIFFRNAASANPAIGVAYASPDADENEVRIIYPQAFTALEMAAYVLGHEVHGHIVEGLGGDSQAEMRANYYGLAAVRALRRTLAQ